MPRTVNREFFRRIGVPINIAIGAFIAGVGFGKLDNGTLDSLHRMALWFQFGVASVGVVFLLYVLGRTGTGSPENIHKSDQVS